MNTPENNVQLGFEPALKRLEEIVTQMEAGTLDLDKMINYFEEGQKLLKHCSGKLNEVERRIEKIVKDSDGNVKTEEISL
jgi:exodeoxyribonuclease VII small subunit